MNFKEIHKNILNKKWLIFWLILFGAILAFDLSVIQTPKYRATSKILVVQRQTAGQDIYTISKSAQYLCRVLKEGVYSDSFLNKIFDSSEVITAEDFPQELKERRKVWKRNVSVKILQDLGVMEIEVFHPQPDKAKNINSAVTEVLTTEHWFYHGGKEDVEIKVLDYSLVSQKPVKPNLWLNTIIGAILGLLIGIIWSGKGQKPKETSSWDRSSPSIPGGGF